MRAAGWLAVAIGCTGDAARPRPALLDPDAGLLGGGPLDPFPSFLHVGPDGHLALDADHWPVPDGGTPVPVERLAWRTGFSPAQPIVVRLDDVEPARLPTWLDDLPGGVRLWDLDAGVALPVHAELDAAPDALDPVLIVRPMVALPVGATVAVVVDREAAARPEAFQRVVDDPRVAPWGPHVAELLARLAALGEPTDAIAAAWDFPVGDATAPVRSAVAQVEPPGAWAFDEVRDRDDGERVVPYVWRAASGTFTVQDFLVGDASTNLLSDGTVAPTGTAEAALYVSIPESLADAPARSAPVWIFGHGMFGDPEAYLDEDPDDDDVVRLADEAGAILVATRWRGLSSDDLGVAIESAADFGAFGRIPDRVVQAHANFRALVELVAAGGLLDDPVLAGRSGQALGDPDRVLYYGISMGAVQGAVLAAHSEDVDAAVLHVGGGMVVTALERGLPWTLLEGLFSINVPDAADRQRAMALGQLWMDPVDPMSWTAELGDRVVLYQESIGDDYIHNMASRALVRSIGAPLGLPAADPWWGIPHAELPLPPGSSATTQFDPEVGQQPDTNRPSEDRGAHGAPRLWDGTRLQVRDFLDPDALGQVVHHCGEAPCSASNPGGTR